jgi:hypothetical protein
MKFSQANLTSICAFYVSITNEIYIHKLNNNNNNTARELEMKKNPKHGQLRQAKWEIITLIRHKQREREKNENERERARAIHKRSE